MKTVIKKIPIKFGEETWYLDVESVKKTLHLHQEEMKAKEKK